MANVNVCLIIDDDADDHLIFQMAIQEVLPQLLCFYSTSCQNAVDLLLLDKIPTPDVLFLDLNMPGMTAQQCLLCLAEIPELSHTRLFALSGSSGEYPGEDLATFGVKKIVFKQGSVHEFGTVLYNAICGQQRP